MFDCFDFYNKVKNYVNTCTNGGLLDQPPDFQWPMEGCCFLMEEMGSTAGPTNSRSSSSGQTACWRGCALGRDTLATAVTPVCGRRRTLSLFALKVCIVVT